jgi:hypothetical protein
MVFWCGLKMNKTCQFINVFVRRGPHKISVQYELHKYVGASWTTHNSNRTKPSKVQVYTQLGDVSGNIIQNKMRIIFKYIIWSMSEKWMVAWSTRLAGSRVI